MDVSIVTPCLWDGERRSRFHQVVRWHMKVQFGQLCAIVCIRLFWRSVHFGEICMNEVRSLIQEYQVLVGSSILPALILNLSSLHSIWQWSYEILSWLSVPAVREPRPWAALLGIHIIYAQRRAKTSCGYLQLSSASVFLPREERSLIAGDLERGVGWCFSSHCQGQSLLTSFLTQS